jgi:hypothetical protein
LTPPREPNRLKPGDGVRRDRPSSGLMTPAYPREFSFFRGTGL